MKNMSYDDFVSLRRVIWIVCALPATWLMCPVIGRHDAKGYSLVVVCEQNTCGTTLSVLPPSAKRRLFRRHLLSLNRVICPSNITPWIYVSSVASALSLCTPYIPSYLSCLSKLSQFKIRYWDIFCPYSRRNTFLCLAPCETAKREFYNRKYQRNSKMLLQNKVEISKLLDDFCHALVPAYLPLLFPQIALRPELPLQ